MHAEHTFLKTCWFAEMEMSLVAVVVVAVLLQLAAVLALASVLLPSRTPRFGEN